MVVEGPGWSFSGTAWDEALPHGLMKSWPLSLVEALDVDLVGVTGVFHHLLIQVQ
jgi:hypothetical protein